MPRKVKIYSDQLLKWAEELYREGVLRREEYDLLWEYLNYHDPDVLDKFDEPPRKYQTFYFPLGYKPTKSDYVRIALERALEWKRYWEGKREEEIRRVERERRLAIELAPFRDMVARDLVNRYGDVIREFERRADVLGLDEEEVVEWIADLKELVYKKPKRVRTEEEVEKLIQEIEKLVEKIRRELDRLEEWEREWQRLSPEERKRRSEEALERLRRMIFGEFD